jgi:myosin heavy subunit
MCFVTVFCFNKFFFIFSYKILNPKEVDQVGDPKKCGAVILDKVALDPELYRLGNTKACPFLEKKILFIYCYESLSFFCTLTVDKHC